MAEEKVRGLHRVAVRDDKGKLGSTQVEISYRRMTIRPPIAKQKRYPALMLTVLHAREPEEPVGRPRIDWKLITDLPVDGHAAAVQKLQCYAMRWKIEVFHKVLKSGCRAEQARLRTAERLVRLLAVFCILSWRMFCLTMLNRVEPDLEPALVLTEELAPQKNPRVEADIGWIVGGLAAVGSMIRYASCVWELPDADHVSSLPAGPALASAAGLAGVGSPGSPRSPRQRRG